GMTRNRPNRSVAAGHAISRRNPASRAPEAKRIAPGRTSRRCGAAAIDEDLRSAVRLPAWARQWSAQRAGAAPTKDKARQWRASIKKGWPAWAGLHYFILRRHPDPLFLPSKTLSSPPLHGLQSIRRRQLILH